MMSDVNHLYCAGDMRLEVAQVRQTWEQDLMTIVGKTPALTVFATY